MVRQLVEERGQGLAQQLRAPARREDIADGPALGAGRGEAGVLEAQPRAALDRLEREGDERLRHARVPAPGVGQPARLVQLDHLAGYDAAPAVLRLGAEGEAVADAGR